MTNQHIPETINDRTGGAYNPFF